VAVTKNSIESWPGPNLHGRCKMVVWQVDGTIDSGPVQIVAQTPYAISGIIRRFTVNEITLQAGGTIIITEDDDILSTKAQLVAFTAGADKDSNLLTAADDYVGGAIANVYTHQVFGGSLTLTTAGLVAANSFQMRLYIEI